MLNSSQGGENDGWKEKQLGASRSSRLRKVEATMRFQPCSASALSRLAGTYLPAETRYSTQTVSRVSHSLLAVFGRTGLESWLNRSLNWDSQRLSTRQNGNETPIVH